MPWADGLGESDDDGDRAAPPSEQPEAPSPTPPGNEWVVRPGDHLWGIAEEVLSEQAGAVVADRQVRDYWLRLIEANRDRLVDPEDPDLIVPGQRLSLRTERRIDTTVSAGARAPRCDG